MGGKMSGMFYVKSTLNGLVMDVEGGSSSPGSQVIMFSQKRSGHDNQLFYEDHATGTIRSKASNLCLEVRGDRLTVQHYQPGNPNQLWMFHGSTIQNRMNPGQVMDIANSDSNPGAKITAWSFNGAPNQQWTKEPAQGHHPGHQPGHQPGQHPGQPSYPGAGYPPVPGYPSAPSYPATPGYPGAPGHPGGHSDFWVKSMMNGLVLDAENGGTHPGTKLIIWSQKARHEAENQLFYLDHMTGTIKSKASNLCIECRGSEIILNNYQPGNMNQQWQLMGDRVAMSSNPNKVLDIANAASNPGAKVCAWDYNGGPNQRWSVEYI